MVPERPVDAVAMYDAERLAFVAMLRDLAPAQLAAMVPATPAWSVHDVLAHLVGITADLNAQHFGDSGDGWTAAQIEARRDATIDDMAAEWDREAPTFEGGLRLFGHPYGAHYLGDLLHHVMDVEAALGRSPVRDDEVVAVGLDFYLQSFEDALVEAGAGAVEVRVGDEGWRLGDGEVVASVAASRFELFRALGGRRTIDEIRTLDWTGRPDVVVGLVSRYPPPTESLGELRSNEPI